MQIHKMEKNEAIMLKAIMQEHTHQVKNILESFTAKIEI